MTESVGGMISSLLKAKDKKPQWKYTELAYDFAKKQKFTEEQGNPSFSKKKEVLYQGRPIIGRDTRINKGVYYRAGGDEACVVDDEKDLVLDKTYQAVLRIIEQIKKEGHDYKGSILGQVWRLTQYKIPYNKEATNRIANQQGPHRKIALGVFFGHGVCRHQALLAAYLLEKLIDDGFLNGHVSVDRNYVPDEGGHAWVRYTNSGGEVGIIDPAQDYFGPLEKITDKQWFYERPSDKRKKILKKVKSLFLGNQG